MDETCDVAPGRAVPERELGFPHTQSRARRVNRHAHLAAEAGRDGKALRAGGSGDGSLARQRLAHVDPSQHADQLSSDEFGDAEAAADPFGENGDVQIGVAVEQGA